MKKAETEVDGCGEGCCRAERSKYRIWENVCAGSQKMEE
jgi:hypothetical protein